MKRIAAIVSLMLVGMVLLIFSRQKLKNGKEDSPDAGEWQWDIIGQETLKHL